LRTGELRAAAYRQAFDGEDMIEEGDANGEDIGRFDAPARRAIWRGIGHRIGLVEFLYYSQARLP
jgi:hypothetical protein